MAEFTHFNTHGDAIMVDVSEKRIPYEKQLPGEGF